MAKFLAEGDAPSEGCCTYVDHGSTCACAKHVASELHPFGTTEEVVLQLPDGGDLNLRQWCRAHTWAVTTEADCYGYPPKPDDETQYALYDADEDDPPVAVFSFKEDALAVAAILTEYSKGAEGLVQVGRLSPDSVTGNGLQPACMTTAMVVGESATWNSTSASPSTWCGRPDDLRG